jgi:DNA-binding transcriptional MerR regulator
MAPPKQPAADLTLAELAGVVSEVLAAGFDGVPSGRVRQIPDARTIRWYQTLGVVDRPAAFRGRVALYGRRHVLQLAAVKRLQAGGLPLAEIQRGLAGRTDAELARATGWSIKAVDDLIHKTVLARSVAKRVRLHKLLEKPATEVVDRRRTAFWKRPVGQPVVACLVEPPAAAVPALQTATLGESIALLWTGSPLTAADRATLEALAGPLVAFLSSVGAQPAAEQAPRATPPIPRPEEGARP